MLGSIIIMGLGIWVFAFSIGMILGKLFWTPPGQ